MSHESNSTDLKVVPLFFNIMFFIFPAIMICNLCGKEMNISEGLTEFDHKRCHISCKENYEKEWRKAKNLNNEF